MSDALLRENPDICCVTEGYCGALSGDWQVIGSDPDYGYRQIQDRRKVYLASRNPWRQLDRIGDVTLPSGRFVSGITTIAGIDLRVIGICIPWAHAHVSTGRKDRRPWQDHETFLNGLEACIAPGDGGKTPTLIVGDFNQTIPRRRAPVRMFDLLEERLLQRFSAATAGLTDDAGLHTVDHVLYSNHFRLDGRKMLPSRSEDGRRLSDHMGVLVNLSVDG